MREVYDGRWERNVGSDGGQTLTWEGRIAVIGAVTTAWDTHHAVTSTMGDRFVLIRASSLKGRLDAGRSAIRNTGLETEMRREMADAVRKLIEGVNAKAKITVTDAEAESILQAANLVTLARTGVEFDGRGELIDAHAPEMPTRFAKQLTQLVRGAIAIGMERREALALAIRCARGLDAAAAAGDPARPDRAPGFSLAQYRAAPQQAAVDGPPASRGYAPVRPAHGTA